MKKGIGFVLLFFFPVFCGCDSSADVAKAKEFYSHEDIERGGVVVAVDSDGSNNDGVTVVNDGREIFNIQTESAGSKPLKAFPHKKHQVLMECGVCHHKLIDDGEPVPAKSTDPVEKCEACHNQYMENPDWDSIKEAFHGKCRTCHRKEGEKEGAKVKGVCNECHLPKAKKMEGC